MKQAGVWKRGRQVNIGQHILATVVERPNVDLFEVMKVVSRVHCADWFREGVHCR